MKTITKEFTLKVPCDLSRFEDAERILFFDIETTGLSSKRDMVYLIGCVYLRDGVWRMKQWFADSVLTEAELLLHFFLFTSRFSVLIHFNGTTFDLPFLKERALLHQIPVSGRVPESFDLYRELRPLKKFLGLPDCRQKTLEAFLGTGRTDPYDGGRLISFYWEYLRTGDTFFSDALLLHNEEDIEGLPELLSLLSYRDFFQGALHVESEFLEPSSGENEASSRYLRLTCVNEACSFPVPCELSAGDCLLSCQGHILSVRIPMFEGTLKYFFSDYANYYYLPGEDYAIHKSVAAFVDKAHRKKATAKTCYQKRKGLFLPVPETGITDRPLFYLEYKKAPFYLEYASELWEDSVFLQKFLLASFFK
ncbi:MAG: ribonuclease H-like domain-containing protein [Lachnospiraceae bacterium]|nr:ribonuclease H-like domain-containing protein [Lachnospiraceae bacterium]